MDDNSFLTHFESATLHGFRHVDHIRMAWLYLRRDGWDEGYPRIQYGIRHFAEAHGATNKYHETITRFWALLVQHCIDHDPHIDDFAVFTDTFPILLDKNAITQHYSHEVLWGESARETWIVPDLIPMP